MNQGSIQSRGLHEHQFTTVDNNYKPLLNRPL